MRISDWSSDVCSSDLLSKGLCPTRGARFPHQHPLRFLRRRDQSTDAPPLRTRSKYATFPAVLDLDLCCTTQLIKERNGYNVAYFLPPPLLPGPYVHWSAPHPPLPPPRHPLPGSGFAP